MECVAFITFFSHFYRFQDTELLVLGCLKWDVSCVTPLDFIDLIISRLPIINKNCTDIDPEKIRKHAQAFISLAVRGKSYFNKFLTLGWVQLLAEPIRQWSKKFTIMDQNFYEHLGIGKFKKRKKFQKNHQNFFAYFVLFPFVYKYTLIGLINKINRYIHPKHNPQYISNNWWLLEVIFIPSSPYKNRISAERKEDNHQIVVIWG